MWSQNLFRIFEFGSHKLKEHHEIPSGVYSGGHAPPRNLLCLLFGPTVFSKNLLKIKCFFSKAAQSFFDFVRVALFILAIFIAFI